MTGYGLINTPVDDIHIYRLEQAIKSTPVYGRFLDGYFPGWFFSRKDVSRMVIFPDDWDVSQKDFVNGRPNV